MRDAYLSVQALNRLGATKTMEGFLGYINTIVAREADRDLKPVYGIIPDIPLTEVKVESLQGPVRIGNLAQEQVQNDSYGSIILAAAQMFFDRRLPVRGDLDLLTQLEQLGLKAVAVAFRFVVAAGGTGVGPVGGRSTTPRHASTSVLNAVIDG